MNPNTAENNWNNKWNQTGDLTVPADGTNCHTVAEGTWDNIGLRTGKPGYGYEGLVGIRLHAHDQVH